MAIPNLNTIKEKSLSERHRKRLEEACGVAPEVIEACGYWTAESVADLESDPSIKPNQYHAPALVLPVHDVNCYHAFSRVRPDESPPAMKYLQPSDTPNVLDIPKTMYEKVMSKDHGLVITEGEITGDALASLGVPTVVLFGVWNWSHKMAEGTPYEQQLLIEDFDRIPLRDRPVTVMFDTDITTNQHIQLAAYRLARRLQERGAKLW